jgi:adenine-specific DNA-methyltransferase
MPLEPTRLAFGYAHSGKKISILEPPIGRTGWLSVAVLTVASLETEDHMLLGGVCDDGTSLDPEQCRRLFSLDAVEMSSDQTSVSDSLQAVLNEQLKRQQNDALMRLTERNSSYFELELNKLDRWSDDLKVGLEQELKELDREIREKRRSAQMAVALAEKLAIQKVVRELDATRNRKRRELFDAQDSVDHQREELIATIEKRLQQQISLIPIFTVPWSLA